MHYQSSYTYTKQRPCRIILWAAKKLGRDVLRHLVRLQESNQLPIQVSAVVLSSRDEYASEIEVDAIEVGALVYIDDDSIQTYHDLGLCIGFPLKISAENLRTCAVGAVNLHFAPLPNYRGSGTVEHALLAGEKKHGVSLHYMADSIDTGPVIENRYLSIRETDSVASLVPQLEKIGYSLVVEYLPKLLRHQVVATPQSLLESTLNIQPVLCTRQLTSHLYRLDHGWTMKKIYKYVHLLETEKKKPYFVFGSKKLFISVQ